MIHEKKECHHLLKKTVDETISKTRFIDIKAIEVVYLQA